MRGKNFFYPTPCKLSKFYPSQRFKKANKGRKAKTPAILRFFLKNAAEGILKPFLRPPRERNEKTAFFLSPSRAIAPALPLKKRKATRRRARTSRGLVVFFLAAAFFGRAAPGERKKRSPTPLAAS